MASINSAVSEESLFQWNHQSWTIHFLQGIRYFTTVETCNGAGLCSTATSNGVIIDNSLPVPGLVIVGSPEKHSRYISDKHTIHSSWIGFQDPHSSIDHFNVCIGEYSIHLSQKNLLRQGDIYTVKITSCNAASICITTMSNEFLVDTTPPQIGGFRSPMEYVIEKDTETLNLNLCWYGFVDVESDIMSYYVTVGHTYSESQLVDSYKITPNTTNALQQEQIITNISSSMPENLVLTIWAENNAELLTAEAKACDNDVDYVTLDETVTACWQGVFSDDESRIEKFMVSLGTLPSVDDIVQMKEVGQSTYTKWENVKLEQGTRYYATVRAINYIGLQSEVSSDGFIIDTIPPPTGILEA
ncbi:uncharacterized protein LOC127702892 [Mytilus californianus]|uniref:uncharacterized protein LOC127702892 n=1 Tax=Mytilus californianus TaxID=6549 RepID=UPI002247E7FD|nr:uncharacterized protein LOC127702892 [Mytilus californianus]